MEQITILTWKYSHWGYGYVSEIRIEDGDTDIVRRTKASGTTPENALANLKKMLGNEWPSSALALEHCGAKVEVFTTLGNFA